MDNPTCVPKRLPILANLPSYFLKLFIQNHLLKMFRMLKEKVYNYLNIESDPSVHACDGQF